MKMFNKVSLAVPALAVAFGLLGPVSVSAATSPSLGAASSYSVLAGSNVTNTVSATTVSGDLGISPSIGAPPHYTNFPPGIVGPPGAIHDADASAAAAQAANTAVFGLIDQGCDTTYAGVQDLTLVSPLPPGVYCSTGSFILTGNLTLTGSTGVWIFKSASTIITSPGSSVTGGDPCNIWWRAASSVTLDTTTAFKGNVLALTAITMNTGAALNGRAMTQTAQISLDANTISGPTCSAPPSGGPNSGTINIVKRVINDNGRTKTIADFALFVNGTAVSSGQTNSFPAPAGVYNVTETSDVNYTATFSGDCDVNGRLNLVPGDNKFCIITNDDIGAPVVVPPVPPLIDVVKVPNPLALPGGPGSVTYTYTARNTGTVAMSNVTLVGDTCSPIVRVSGDTNGDNNLDVSETWVHTCTTTLSATHTNTVVATGWANGLSATDIASATVVVGVPLVPPLIHVTKVPNPLTLLAGGGNVVYTERITNPGTVPLNNVGLSDDKCAMSFVSGDANGDSRLDVSETWTYTCSTFLNRTTTNTATATGEANGFTVRDFAIATVVVAEAVPALPLTGFAPGNGRALPVAAAGVAATALLLYVARKKQTA